MDEMDFGGNRAGLGNIAIENDYTAMGMTSEQRAAWGLLRGVIFEEMRAAGCCAEWLARLAGARAVGEAMAMLTSSEGLAFCAERGVPTLATMRAAAGAVNLPYYGVYVDGEDGPYERWRRGGAAVFAGPARSVVYCMLGVVYEVLALHGAEVEVRVGAGARVHLLAGAGGRLRVQSMGPRCSVVRWENEAARWRAVRGAGEVVE